MDTFLSFPFLSFAQIESGPKPKMRLFGTAVHFVLAVNTERRFCPSHSHPPYRTDPQYFNADIHVVDFFTSCLSLEGSLGFVKPNKMMR